MYRAETADDGMMRAAGLMPNDGSEKLFVSFSLHPRQDEKRSREEGRPNFEDVEYIRIFVPGDKTQQVHRPVREDDKRRFARQYAAYKAGQSEALVGTPLAQWPGITRSQVEELAYFHVRTVEQLANMQEGNASRFIGIQALKARARDFLEAAKSNAHVESMRAALADRDNKIEVLERQMKEAMARLDEAATEKKKTKGGSANG